MMVKEPEIMKWMDKFWRQDVSSSFSFSFVLWSDECSRSFYFISSQSRKISRWKNIWQINKVRLRDLPSQETKVLRMAFETCCCMNEEYQMSPVIRHLTWRKHLWRIDYRLQTNEDDKIMLISLLMNWRWIGSGYKESCWIKYFVA